MASYSLLRPAYFFPSFFSPCVFPMPLWSFLVEGKSRGGAGGGGEWIGRFRPR